MELWSTGLHSKGHGLRQTYKLNITHCNWIGLPRVIQIQLFSTWVDICPDLQMMNSNEKKAFYVGIYLE